MKMWTKIYFVLLCALLSSCFNEKGVEGKKVSGSFRTTEDSLLSCFILDSDSCIHLNGVRCLKFMGVESEKYIAYIDSCCLNSKSFKYYCSVCFPKDVYDKVNKIIVRNDNDSIFNLSCPQCIKRKKRISEFNKKWKNM